MARGRPRSFDRIETLDRIRALFWRDGFDGASMQQLADAVGVSKPSLYESFGNKESLFLAALARYVECEGEQQAAALDAECDVRLAVLGLLNAMIDTAAECGRPAGCMVVSSTSLCASSQVPDAVQAAIRPMLERSTEALARRLERAARDGELPPGADVRAIAEYLGTVLCGLGVQARAGADRDTMRQVVATAMYGWPFCSQRQPC
jgi:TetR/AcrR family transcriptional regulator, copper-responsive repressor